MSSEPVNGPSGDESAVVCVSESEIKSPETPPLNKTRRSISNLAYHEGMQKALEIGIEKRVAGAIWEAWSKYDQDGTGKLDTIEATHLLQKFFDEGYFEVTEIDDIVKKYDANNDNAWDFGEFCALLQDISTENNIGIGAVLLRASAIKRDALDEPIKLPKTQIVRYLEMEITQMDACLHLIPTLLLFVILGASFTLHQAPEVVHAQQKGIHFDILENANFAFGGALPYEPGRMGHKTLYDVSTYTDFWSWMDVGLLPLIFHTSWDQNEARAMMGVKACTSESDLLREWGWKVENTSKVKPSYCDKMETENQALVQTVSEQGMYLYYHRLLGGLRLQQELSEETDCVQQGLRAMYGMPCYKSPFHLEPEIPASFVKDESKINTMGSETQWFLTPMSLADARVKVRELENKKWARQATQRIEVAFPTYNAIEGTVTVTYIHIFVNRGGHFWKQVVLASAWMDLYHAGPIAYIVDAIFALMILHIFLLEMADVISHWRSRGLVRGSLSYIGWWNVVDWLSVILAVAIFACLVIYASKASDLQEHLDMYDYTLPGGFEDGVVRTDEMMTQIESIVMHARSTRILFAFYAFVVGLRLFKVFAAQPRLALVTMTISKAAVDIIHFGLVFFLTIAIYALSAMALFGHELQEFATYPRSFRSTLLALLGDFDLPAKEEVGRALTGLWFWSFQIFVVNIMFNLLLAVVIDAYTAVKVARVDAETLWSQSYEIWSRYRGRVARTRVSLAHILKVLKTNKAGMYDHITAEDLCNEVEGLPIKQARLIFTEVDAIIEKENRREVTLQQALDRLSRVESSTKTILKGVEIMMDTSSRKSSTTSKPSAPSDPSAPSEPSKPSAPVADQQEKPTDQQDQFERIQEMFKQLEISLEWKLEANNKQLESKIEALTNAIWSAGQSDRTVNHCSQGCATHCSS